MEIEGDPDYYNNETLKNVQLQLIDNSENSYQDILKNS